MITGFNTDIQYNDVIYHIQTEDKGLDTPLILSLVYKGGTILASKRASYDDLLSGSFNETELANRLQRQHKLICAAVKAGRIEDLKRMTAKQNQPKSSFQEKPIVKTQPIKPEVATILRIPKPAVALENPPTPIQSRKDEFSPNFSDIYAEKPLDPRIPKPAEELIWEIPDSAIKDLIIDDVEIIEEEFLLPAEAVEVVAPVVFPVERISKSKRTPIIEEETLEEKLTINLLKNATFKAGEQKTLEIFVNNGNKSKGLNGAHILVKILGSSFRPLIFHGKTDDRGIASIDLKLPNFKQGRAAILIKAMSEGEEVELRRTITQN